jgi:hypothetical protein
MPIRHVTVIHLDGSTRSLPDDGCNKSGEPNQQRAHLIAMLLKTTKVKKVKADGSADGFVMMPGEAGEEPRPLRVNVFRLAEPPKRFPFDQVPDIKNRTALEAADRIFTDNPPMRNGTGGWNLPDEAWLAHSKAWQAHKAWIAKEHETIVAQAQRLKAGEAMESFLLEAVRRKDTKGQPSPRQVGPNG